MTANSPSRSLNWDLVREQERIQFRLFGRIDAHRRVIKAHAWHEHPDSLDTIYDEIMAMGQEMDELREIMLQFWSWLRTQAQGGTNG